MKNPNDNDKIHSNPENISQEKKGEVVPAKSTDIQNISHSVSQESKVSIIDPPKYEGCEFVLKGLEFDTEEECHYAINCYALAVNNEEALDEDELEAHSRMIEKIKERVEEDEGGAAMYIDDEENVLDGEQFYVEKSQEGTYLLVMLNSELEQCVAEACGKRIGFNELTLKFGFDIPEFEAQLASLLQKVAHSFPNEMSVEKLISFTSQMIDIETNPFPEVIIYSNDQIRCSVSLYHGGLFNGHDRTTPPKADIMVQSNRKYVSSVTDIPSQVKIAQFVKHMGEQCQVGKRK